MRPVSSGSAPGAGSGEARRPGKPRARYRPSRQQRLVMALNRVRAFLGPALTAAVILVLILLAIGMIVLMVSERHNPNMRSGWSALRWVVVGLLDKPPWDPVTPAGNVVALAMGLLQPTSIALVTAALTSHLFGVVVKRVSGMGRARVKDHIVICGWSSKGAEILKEIRGRDDEESQRPVVVLAELDASPTKDPLTTFIHGDPTEAADLSRAGIEHARTAIALADNSYPDIDAEEMDSRTLLTVLAIESINPSCYTCVEVVRSRNREHFKRTKADELVVSAHLTGALLAHSAITRGLSSVVGDLLTFPEGNEFYWVAVPAGMAGRTFEEALLLLKQRSECLAIAVASDGHGYRTNPPRDEVLKQGDRLLVIAAAAPDLSWVQEPART